MMEIIDTITKFASGLIYTLIIILVIIFIDVIIIRKIQMFFLNIKLARILKKLSTDLEYTLSQDAVNDLRTLNKKYKTLNNRIDKYFGL